MPIEGPLRELGIHDVFQLLDLSRKTGVLRVTSQLRDDEGVVYFDGGRVVHASIRSRPSRIEPGNEREVDRRVRQQIENTVFDLMSWREGFFSFEERQVADVPADAVPAPDAAPPAESHLEFGFTAVRSGNLGAARASFEHFLRLVPSGPGADRARNALEGIAKLTSAMESNGAHGSGGQHD